MIADEMPTREIKPNLGDDGLGDFVLAESRHVTSRYIEEDGQRYKKDCRAYDYSHYLIMPAPTDGQPDQERTKAALEALVCSDLFLDVYNYQLVSEDPNIPFEDQEIKAEELAAVYEEVRKICSYKGKLEEEFHALFLARFWEACWRISCGDDVTPLIVVATSPERNTETNGEAVIPEGVIFFHDQVLPYLPEAVKQMICISFGCLADQVSAQAGTACRVCYPESEALNADISYRPFSGDAFDAEADEIHIKLGQAMINKEYPEPYNTLEGLKNNLLIAQDFDLARLFIEFETYAGELKKDETDYDRQDLLQECIAIFKETRMRLETALYGLSNDQITRILYPYELKLANLCEEFIAEYKADLFRDWKANYESLKDRSKDLKDNQKKELKSAWHRVLTKAFSETDWKNSPLMNLCDSGLNEDNAALIQSILKNKQLYRASFTEEDESDFNKLLQLEQKANVTGNTKLAGELLKFLNEHCSCSDILLSPAAYLKNLKETLKNESDLSGDRITNFTNDLKLLTQAYMSQSKGDKQEALRVCFDTFDEAEPYLRTIKSSNITSEQITKALYGYELELIHLCSRYIQTYDSALYENWKEKYYTLKRRNSELDEQERSELKNEWRKVLTKSLEETDWANSPLLSLCNSELNADNAELIGSVLDNGQKYRADFSEGDASIFTTLLLYEQKACVGNESELAHKLLNFLIAHNTSSEVLLSPLTYLDTLGNGTNLSRDQIDAYTTDLKQLMQRHMAIVQQGLLQNTTEAKAELEVQRQLWEKAEGSALRINTEQMTALLPDLERMIPEWYFSSTQPFEEELYKTILERAISLPKRAGRLSPEDHNTLESAYDDCLCRSYYGESDVSCPLTVLASYDSKDVTQWENRVLDNAIREQSTGDQATPCDYKTAVDRLIRLRLERNQETADKWLELLKKAYMNQDEILGFYMRITGKEELPQVDPSCELKLHTDIVEIINSMEQTYGEIRIRDIKTFNQWYKERNGRRTPDLTKLLNNKFMEELKNRIDFGGKQSEVLEDYIGGASPEIRGLLLEQFREMDLARFNDEDDALKALEIYSKQDNSTIREFHELIRRKVDESEDLRIDQIPALVELADRMKLGDIKDELNKILLKTKQDELNQKVIDSICAYIKQDPRSANPLTKTLFSRVEESTDDFEHKASEFLKYLETSDLEDSQKAPYVKDITRMLSEKSEGGEVSGELFNVLLPAAAKAAMHKTEVRKDIMKYYAKAGENVNLNQQEQFAKALGIDAADAVRQADPVWQQYFLQRKTTELCDTVRREHYSVNQILDIAEDSKGQLEELENLRSGIMNNEGAEEVIRDSEKEIERLFRGVVSEDKELDDAGDLSKIINRLNACNKNKTYLGMLVKQAYDHVGSLLKDDTRFRELTNDATKIRQLKTCMDALQTGKDGDIRDKETAVSTACSLLDYYDRLAESDEYSGDELHKMLDRHSMIDWHYVSEVVKEYGNEKLMSCPKEKQIIPQLFNALEQTSDGKRVQWVTFLNGACELEQKGGWMNTNIWKSEENTYGFLAFMMNFLDQDDLKNEKESFISFLNASEIGKKAHNPKKIAEIRKHFDDVMKNPMLDWILEGSNTAEA